MLDQPGPGQLDAVVRLLEVLTDPENVPIRDAPVDDEPESDEEARAVAASKEWFRNHQGIPFEEVAADTGAGRVKVLKGEEGERRLGVGGYRVRFTEESGEGQQESESRGAIHIHAVPDRKDAYR